MLDGLLRIQHLPTQLRLMTLCASAVLATLVVLRYPPHGLSGKYVVLKMRTWLVLFNISGLTWCLGLLLNITVMAANNGRMPVRYADADIARWHAQNPNGIHVAESTHTNIRWLGDIFPWGYVIYSPGDLLMHASTKSLAFIIAMILVRLVQALYQLPVHRRRLRW